MRIVFLGLAMVAVATSAAAQTKGGAVAAQQQGTRQNSSANGTGLQIPPYVTAPQSESCAVEDTIGTGQLRFGFNLNFARALGGCERRRDSHTLLDMAALSAAINLPDRAVGYLRAAQLRMCQEGADARALEGAGFSCAPGVVTVEK